MQRRSRNLPLVCLIGLLISLTLAGLVLIAKARALQQISRTCYTPLSGEGEWEGDWEISELGADPSQAGGERVSIPFDGTGFSLQVRRGDYRGYLYVSVDGRPANRLPREERGSYLVLTSPDYTPQVVTITVAEGLADGPHSALIVTERGWDQWPLVGWCAIRGPDMRLYDRALPATVVLAIVALLGLVWYGAGDGKQGEARGGDGDPAADEGVPVIALQSSLAALHSRPRVAFAAMLIAAGMAYFSPWLPLTLASGLVLATLVVLRLDFGLALVAAMAPFYLHPRALFGKAFSMVEIATLLCMLSWGLRVVRAWLASRPRESALLAAFRSLTSLDLAALLFVLLAFASLAVAEYQHVARRELRVLIVEPALFYLMLRTSRLDERSIWRVVDLFVMGAVAVAFIGLVQYALGVNIITAEAGFRRLRSIYGSPNSVGLYLGRVLPVLVAVGLFGASRRRHGYALAILPLGLAVLLSFSRGALMVGVPISLLALGLFAGATWLWAALGGVIAAALAAVVAAKPLVRNPRFASLLDATSGTTFFRLQLWRSSWAMFRDHPWLGVGPDNFLYQFRGRYIMPAAWQEPHISQAHNILLDYATRMGIPGLVAGAWLQIAFWRQALPLRRLADPDRRALALGLMASMVDFLAHGLVDASYFLIDLAFAFFLTLGMVEWLVRSGSSEVET